MSDMSKAEREGVCSDPNCRSHEELHRLREQVETLTMRLGERDEDVRRETQRADEAERWRSSLEEENETLRRRLEDAGRALTELERQIKTERLTRGKVEWTD